MSEREFVKVVNEDEPYTDEFDDWDFEFDWDDDDGYEVEVGEEDEE